MWCGANGGNIPRDVHWCGVVLMVAISLGMCIVSCKGSTSGALCTCTALSPRVVPATSLTFVVYEYLSHLLLRQNRTAS